jgi:hypothetical protein
MAVNLELLAGMAFAEAQRHPGRSPERRAASHLLFAITEPPAKTIDAVRRAIATFGDEQSQTDALDLLDKIITGRTT